jgi:CAAX protease family protein
MTDQDLPSSGLARALSTHRLAGLLQIVLVFGVAGLVLAVGWPFVAGDPLRFQALAWAANVGMLAAVWLGLRVRGEGWSHLGLGRGAFTGRALWSTLWKSVVVFAAAMAAFVLGAIFMAILIGRPVPADFGGYNYLSGNLPMLALALASVFLVSSLGEEVIYRGFLITRLEDLGGGGKTALRWALIASSILFGLVHFAWGPAGMVQTAFMGLALGVAFLVVRRNLWILVVAHFCMDAILMVQMYLAPPA